MPETFAQQMVAIIQAQLLQMGGMASANIDGQQIVAKDLKLELLYWESKVGQEQGSRPRVSRIRLDGR